MRDPGAPHRASGDGPGAVADREGVQLRCLCVRPAAAGHRRSGRRGESLNPGPRSTPMTNVSVTASQRQAARIAGLAYVFGILYVPVYVLTSGGLTVAGDPAATFANVQA